MEKAKEQASAPVEPIAIAPQHEPTIEEMEVEARTETRCKVCQHENRAEIDGLLSLGFPLRSITQIFGLRKSSVDRHRQNHLPLFPNSEKAHQVVRGEEALHVPLLLLRDARYWAATGIINRLWDILMRILGNSPRDELCRCIIQALPYLWQIELFPWRMSTGEIEKAYQATREILESWGMVQNGKDSEQDTA